jgi:hypothetical protein
MNKKGVMLQVLIFLVVVIFTSALMLLLVKMGVVDVQSGNSEPILNTEFIPLERGGTLVMKSVEFCGYIDEIYQCYSSGKNFSPGDDVYVLFVVETSVYNSNIMLVRNYRITDSLGKVILDVEEKNNYHFEEKSGKQTEIVTFADFFTTGTDYLEGEYTLDVIVENPLLNKKMTKKETFELVAEDYDEFEDFEENHDDFEFLDGDFEE